MSFYLKVVKIVVRRYQVLREVIVVGWMFLSVEAASSLHECRRWRAANPGSGIRNNQGVDFTNVL